MEKGLSCEWPFRARESRSRDVPATPPTAVQIAGPYDDLIEWARWSQWIGSLCDGLTVAPTATIVYAGNVAPPFDGLVRKGPNRCRVGLVSLGEDA
jgi:hypothetical protein